MAVVRVWRAGDRHSRSGLHLESAFTGRSGIGPFFGVDGLPSGPDVVRKQGPLPFSSPTRERLPL